MCWRHSLLDRSRYRSIEPAMSVSLGRGGLSGNSNRGWSTCSTLAPINAPSSNGLLAGTLRMVAARRSTYCHRCTMESNPISHHTPIHFGQSVDQICKSIFNRNLNGLFPSASRDIPPVVPFYRSTKWRQVPMRRPLSAIPVITIFGLSLGVAAAMAMATTMKISLKSAKNPPNPFKTSKHKINSMYLPPRR